ncbi:hypothetical protein PENFLA_c050G10293 [Penicillium flavigenum]|uniref:Uncharacterized protein n=1 Tax=Penicillium flavigenum TaxID=254877 RepID=A0A1V6SHZ9_9EURO|nr:hypothetical protein PENFLA_c050G10293 [Penicillium flavigenum]
MSQATTLYIKYASLMNQITGLDNPRQEGFAEASRALSRDELKASMWKTRSSESEDGKHVRLSECVSAAVAVRTDGKGKGKRKTSTSAV